MDFSFWCLRHAYGACLSRGEGLINNFSVAKSKINIADELSETQNEATLEKNEKKKSIRNKHLIF